jgi:DNA-binding Lrp family transcriptional regulator
MENEIDLNFVDYNRYANKNGTDKKDKKNVFGETGVCWVDYCIHYKIVYKKYGTTIGAIFDEIANQCNMNTVCTLSQRTLAEEIGSSWRTVLRNLNIMLDEGLIEKVDHPVNKKTIEGNTSWYIISKEKVYKLQNEKIEIKVSNINKIKDQKKGIEKLKNDEEKRNLPVWGENEPVYNEPLVNYEIPNISINENIEDPVEFDSPNIVQEDETDDNRDLLYYADQI